MVTTFEKIKILWKVFTIFVRICEKYLQKLKKIEVLNKLFKDIFNVLMVIYSGLIIIICVLCAFHYLSDKESNFEILFLATLPYALIHSIKFLTIDSD